MLGHRALNVEDYRAILKRRGWIIAIPTILFPIIAYAITFFIAPLYISKTLVLIEQQKVPADYVRPVITEDIDSRMASMRQQILSRSSLQPIIEKYDLYGPKTAMDDRIDTMRKAIGIDPIHSDISRSDSLPGFTISFQASDAHSAQQVCSDIVALFIKQNILSRAATVNETTSFLQNQLADAKRSLDDQDEKVAAFERQYFGQLPSDENSNINILATLDTQLDAATQALNQLEVNKSFQEAMLAQQSANGASGAPAQSPEVQEGQLKSLEEAKADLLLHYQPDYPDVRAVQRKIDDLQKQLDKSAANPLPALPPSANHTDSMTVQQLRASLRSIDMGIQEKRKQQAQLENQVRGFQQRVQSSPKVEEEFKSLTRDYQTSQSAYDSLLGKINQSKMATDLEIRQQGEQFRMVDEPNLPDGPFYPKKQLFLYAGLAAGLAVGLLIVALLEYNDTSLRTERDVWAFTQLPTLAVIAWSGEVAHRSGGKRLFGRKPPKDLLGDAPG